jgi:thiamine kinase-like enzyme
VQKLEQIIARVPGWAEADVAIEPLGGLTNTNYRVQVDGERFVLRVSGENADYLGIDRQAELEALRAASRAGIGPEVVHVLQPEGHLVTRFINGHQWTVEEYRTPETLRRVVETVRRMHALPPIRTTFSPFQRVASYAEQARHLGVPFPEDWNVFSEKVRAIQAERREDSTPWLGLCHNDLFAVNLLDDGQVRILDWEFAGMGDIYFDLAGLVWAYDEDGPLPEALERHLLQCYFGEVTAQHHRRLAGMKFMLLFFTAMWGTLQHGLQIANIQPPYEAFDCLAYARETFDALRQMC